MTANYIATLLQAEVMSKQLFKCKSLLSGMLTGFQPGNRCTYGWLVNI